VLCEFSRRSDLHHAAPLRRYVDPCLLSPLFFLICYFLFVIYVALFAFSPGFFLFVVYVAPCLLSPLVYFFLFVVYVAPCLLFPLFLFFIFYLLFMSPPVCFLPWFFNSFFIFIYSLCHHLFAFSPGFIYLFINYVTPCLISPLVLFSLFLSSASSKL
jgi:hypothetical protein